MIGLGSKVKHIITGFEGIVTGRTEWLTGCSTYGVRSASLKDGLPSDAVWFDEVELEFLSDEFSRAGIDTGGVKEIPKRNLKGA